MQPTAIAAEVSSDSAFDMCVLIFICSPPKCKHITNLSYLYIIQKVSNKVNKIGLIVAFFFLNVKNETQHMLSKQSIAAGISAKIRK